MTYLFCVRCSKSSSLSSVPAFDDMVELLGCGVVSTKTVELGHTDDIADIKRITAGLEKKYAKKLQADAEAEEAEEELRASERGRSTLSARAARTTQRRHKGKAPKSK